MGFLLNLNLKYRTRDNIIKIQLRKTEYENIQPSNEKYVLLDFPCPAT